MPESRFPTNQLAVFGNYREIASSSSSLTTSNLDPTRNACRVDRWVCGISDLDRAAPIPDVTELYEYDELDSVI
jgi:hypothetical protein